MQDKMDMNECLWSHLVGDGISILHFFNAMILPKRTRDRLQAKLGIGGNASNPQRSFFL